MMMPHFQMESDFLTFISLLSSQKSSFNLVIINLINSHNAMNHWILCCIISILLNNFIVSWHTYVICADCIGSAFNAKGAMQCPNCRKVEKGRWLYANGHRSSSDFDLDAWVSEDFYDLSYSELVSFSIMESFSLQHNFILDILYYVSGCWIFDINLCHMDNIPDIAHLVSSSSISAGHIHTELMC